MFAWSKLPEPKPEPEPMDEDDLVRAWRMAAALALGYEWAEAVRITDSHIDLHALQDLLDHGASHEQAYQILA